MSFGSRSYWAAMSSPASLALSAMMDTYSAPGRRKVRGRSGGCGRGLTLLVRA